MTQVYVSDISIIDAPAPSNLITTDDCTVNPTSNVENPSSPSSQEKEDQEEFNVDLELEKAQHQWKTNVRANSFKAILSNAPIQIDWASCSFYITVTIVMCFIATAPCSLIPTHNVFSHPDYLNYFGIRDFF